MEATKKPSLGDIVNSLKRESGRIASRQPTVGFTIVIEQEDLASLGIFSLRNTRIPEFALCKSDQD